MSHKSVISGLSERASRTSMPDGSKVAAVSKVDVAAEVAVLKVKLNFVDIENRKRGELEKLETEKQLAMAQAKLKVLEHFDQQEETFIYGIDLKPADHADSCLGVNKKEQVQNFIQSLDIENPPVNVDNYDTVNSENINLPTEDVHKLDTCNHSSRLDVGAKEFMPHGYGDVKREESFQDSPQQATNVSDIVRTFAEQMELSRLPVPEPSVFYGDAFSYPAWKNAFEMLIERRAVPPSERLYYLQRYLSGSAKEAVEGYFLLSTPEAYDEAKQILEERYGNPFDIAKAFRDKLDSWPKIPGRNGLALRKFGDFLRQCQSAMVSISSLSVLGDVKENRNMVAKLPEWLAHRWTRIVAQWKDDKKSFPPFEQFVNFIVKEAKIACEPVTFGLYKDLSREPLSRSTTPYDKTRKQMQHSKHAVTLATVVKSCDMCNKAHNLEDCSDFKNLPIRERKDLALKKGLCFGCLLKGHLAKNCPDRRICNKCKRRHPTVFHMDPETSNVAQPQSEKEKIHVKSVSGRTAVSPNIRGNKCSTILPVWISHESDPKKELLVYALLDTQSDTSFILDSMCESLGINGPEIQLMLSTMHAENQVVQSRRIKGLVVRGYRSPLRISLPTTYTRGFMPANREHIPTPEIADQWPHLRRISSEIMLLADCDIGLLIGYNCSRALAPRDVIPPNGNQPYAQRTDLGWSIVGLVDPNEPDCDSRDPIGTSHRIVAYPVPYDVTGTAAKEVVVAMRTTIKETILPFQVNRLIEHDFVEKGSEDTVMSYDDKKFLKILKEGTCRNSDSHYEMPLPFRYGNPKLPNNKKQAASRLQYLASRFQKNPQYFSDYVDFMSNIIQKGYAEKCDSSSLEDLNKTVWYIPHHGIYHPNKPNKLRVVFDCSARYCSESLNDYLLQGPDLTNTLIGVLCRFRQEKVAFTCDVEQMFFQFHVSPPHRDYLRFLWWESSDYSSEPVDYRMKVHLFGASSSPGCANYGLKRIADDFESVTGSEAANFVRSDFYVDDGLKSVPSVEEAVNLIQKSIELCEKGGLKLHKFTSNSKKVVAAIPAVNRSQDLKNLNLLHDPLPMERVLGVQWCIETDNFEFRITLRDTPLTRRGILSTVGSIYDPLGLVAPVVIVGKGMLQELCRDCVDWDEPVSESIRSRWERWRSQLPSLESLSVDRCFKPDSFGTVVRQELHHFSDASNNGYGQCSYLRLVDDRGRIHCSFVMGKARVAPLRQITVPRLELAAALMSVKMSALISRELTLGDFKEIFWSDSKVVLSYIANDSKRFQVFVANRVSQIRERTDPSQWRYVQTDFNPADDASRGVSVENLLNKSRWLLAPSFLWKENVSEESDSVRDLSVAVNDPEVKHVRAHLNQAGILKNFNIERFEHCTNWHQLKRTVAHCLQYKERLLERIRRRPKTSSDEHTFGNALTVNNLQDAETEIVRLVQQTTFTEEYETLLHLKAKGKAISERQHGRTLKQRSCLYRLDPFIDESGIIRVGGRVRRSNLTVNEKHPVVLPKKSFISELIIRYYHEKIGHQGRGMTLNEIRQNGFWIIGCSYAVSRHVYKCVQCRKLRRPVQEQKMADLPAERAEYSPPFSYCGVDCFGPFSVKEGRKTMKRYGVLFTCLSCRAVHIEVASSLSTDSFLNSLRRFQSLRGPIRELRCDRGTNLVGASNELKEGLKENGKVRAYLLEQGCDLEEFNMNVPSASHMGGIWERQIRSVRNALTPLMEKIGGQLSDEALRTLMYEAAAIVNSRPLCVDQLADPCALEPLSANHLLTLKSKVVLPPPGHFQKADVYLNKQWRKVQFFVNEFWNRWKKEVLQDLQVRQKWLRPRKNLNIGDIVMICDDNLPRNQWKLGRVLEAYSGDDELVRKVKLCVADRSLDDNGKRVRPTTILERPVQKLILLVENTED